MRRTKAAKPFSTKSYVPYEQISAYLSDVYRDAKDQDGYICIRSGPDRSSAQSWIDVKKISEMIKIELQGHDYRDTFFSFSSFKKSKCPERSLCKMQNIFAWSLDIDYQNENIDPKDIYEYIVDHVELPVPNYIECGHRLRMIYLFDEPLRLFPAQKDKLIKGFSFIQKSFCSAINDELSFGDTCFGAESNPATSFFRIPGSVNSKDGSTIKLEHITDERYTLQELFDEFITAKVLDLSGNKDTWYEAWRIRKLNSEKPLFSIHKLWKRRQNAFLEMRSDTDVRRKTLCFLYGQSLIHLNEVSSSQELLEKLYEFNRGFICPLSERVIQSRDRLLFGHKYKYTDKKIAELLGSSYKKYAGYCKKDRDAARYDLVREVQIRSKKAKYQKIEIRREKIKSLLLKLCPVLKIAKLLHVSISTVKRDIKFLKLNGFKLPRPWRGKSSPSPSVGVSDCLNKAIYKITRSLLTRIMNLKLALTKFGPVKTLQTICPEIRASYYHGNWSSGYRWTSTSNGYLKPYSGPP